MFLGDTDNRQYSFYENLELYEEAYVFMVRASQQGAIVSSNLPSPCRRARSAINDQRSVNAGFVFFRRSKSATTAVGRIKNIWWGFFRQVEYALCYASEKETSRSKAIGPMAPSLALVAGFDRGDFSHCISAGEHIRRVVACGAWEVADRRAERAGFIAFLFFTMGCLAALERVTLAIAG